MGGRQTFEDITLNRHHPLGTAAVSTPAQSPAQSAPRRTGPVARYVRPWGTTGGVLALVASSVEGGTDIGLVPASPAVTVTVWTVCEPVMGCLLLAGEQRDDSLDRRIGPRLYP